MASLTEQHREPQQSGQILCCLCGKQIPYNAAAMCGECLRAEVDITDSIPEKGLKIMQCRKCLRFMGKNGHYVPAQLESVELLALCLKRIPSLAKQELVDAAFIWTEPHSMRLKIKLQLKRDVLNGVILQQLKVVEFIIQWQQCNDCSREYTNQTWKAVVQVRQRVDHKRTFFYLEQQILAANAQHKAIDMQALKDGMDFFFADKGPALQFADWLSTVVPQKLTKSNKLVSTDNHSNVVNDKLTLRCDLVPLCKGDLVIGVGGQGAVSKLAKTLCIVNKVTSVVQLLDPATLVSADLTPDRYWRTPVTALMTASHLTEYMVLDIEPVRQASTVAGTSQSADYLLSEAEVVRVADFGVNDVTTSVLTHLGRILQPGDTVLGYDLRSRNFSADLTNTLRGELPDVVLIKKAPQKAGKSGKRRMKLRKLDRRSDDEPVEARAHRGRGKAATSGVEDDEAEYEEFVRELETDPEMLKQLGLEQFAEPRDHDGTHQDNADATESGDALQAVLTGLDNVQIHGQSEAANDTEHSSNAA